MQKANTCVSPRRQPYSTYAVHLTTLSPPALLGDMALVLFLWMATLAWSEHNATMAIYGLLSWMFVSKFIKLLGHYARFPVDLLLLPVSIFFGWFHGFIKMYACWTLHEVCVSFAVV